VKEGKVAYLIIVSSLKENISKQQEKDQNEYSFLFNHTLRNFFVLFSFKESLNTNVYVFDNRYIQKDAGRCKQR